MTGKLKPPAQNEMEPVLLREQMKAFVTVALFWFYIPHLFCFWISLSAL